MCKVIVPIRGSFMECTRDLPYLRWTSYSRTLIQRAHGLLGSLPSRVIRLVDEVAFIKLVEDSS